MAFIHSRVSDAEPHECLRIPPDSIAPIGVTSDEDSIFYFFVCNFSKLQMEAHCKFHDLAGFEVNKLSDFKPNCLSGSSYRT